MYIVVVHLEYPKQRIFVAFVVVTEKRRDKVS
jgi:mRNA-degrading endonuclease HigB of HigAB toxin-antitoxin module